MAVFEYRGILIATGKATRGVRDADSPNNLRALLRKDGILLTSATEEAKATAKKKHNIELFSFAHRLNSGDVAATTRQLATLVRAGIPLVDSLTAMTDQVEKEELKRVLTNVRERLNEGSSFAHALEQHPKIFLPIFVNMVAAGEVSGTLEQVLDRLADFLDSQARLKGKVGAALAYPAMLALIGVVMISVLMVAVVPKVTSIFESMDKALPWYTQLLIGISDLMSGYWWAMLPAVILGVWWFRRWKKTTTGRMKWSLISLRAPLVGRLVRMLAIARFARTLSTLLAAGVPVLKALDIAYRVLDNARLEQIVQEAALSIREGQNIADPLRRSGEFPPLVTHMIAVGEKSGQLEQMLESVANSYDQQVEIRVQALTSVLEPLIIVFMGATVGFVAFSILMPLIQMNDFVK